MNGFDWAAAVTVIKDVWWILSVPFGAAGLFGMFYLKTQFPTKKQHDEQTAVLQKSIAALTDRVASNEQQVTRIESDMRQLPDRKEVQALGDRIGRVEKEVATSTETVRGVEKTVTKIDHTLSLILKHMLETKAP